MIYSIDLDFGSYTGYNRKDVLEWLRILKGEKIIDIRKMYRNGDSVSVKEMYKRHIR